MKKLVMAMIAALSFSPAAMAELPAILAKVNGRPVTKVEIEKAFAGIAMDQPGQKKLTFEQTPPDFQKVFVEKYVEKQLIVDAARKAKMQDDPEIKQKLKDAEDFLIQQKFLTDIIMKKNSDEALKKAYKEKMKNSEGKEEIHAYQILVKSEDDAKKIEQQLKDGSDFEKLAKQKSTDTGAKMDAGDLGYFTEDSAKQMPEFTKAAFALKKGEVSDPVHTAFGWHIIKVTDRRSKQFPSFEKVKPALEKEMASDLIEDEVKRLKISADIEYFGSLKTIAKPEAPKPLIKKVDDKTTADSKAEEKAGEKKPDKEKTTPEADKANDVKAKTVDGDNDDSDAASEASAKSNIKAK